MWASTTLLRDGVPPLPAGFQDLFCLLVLVQASVQKAGITSKFGKVAQVLSSQVLVGGFTASLGTWSSVCLTAPTVNNTYICICMYMYI